MRMTEGLDEGPVLAGVSTRIDALDTAGSVAERLASGGAELMAQALERLARGEADFADQPEEGATYARKINAAEARIRWDRSAARVDRQIRGLSPFPGAWFLVPGARGPVRVKALLSRVEDGVGEEGVALDDQLLIGCGEGAVRILRAQREGRGAADAAEFLRGFPVGAGARLG
jgi:methionyl-tRNA formyltransferase